MEKTSFIAMALVLGTASACSGRDSSVDDWGLNETVSDGSELAEPTQNEVTFGVYVPTGVERTRLTLSAEESVGVGARVELREADQSHATTVSGFQAVGVKPEAQLGAIYGGDVSIDGRVEMPGFIRATDSVTLSGQVDVKMGTTDRAPVAMTSYRWNVSFPAAAGAPVVLADKSVRDIVPGGYAGLVVEAGSTASLSAGQYFLDSLDVQKDAVLEIDNTDGPVYIWVRHDLAVAGAMVNISPAPSVLFGYAGTEPVALSSGFRGTLVAPFSMIALPRTDSPHVGSFFGRSIVVEDGALIHHIPFIPNAGEDFDPAQGVDGWVMPLPFYKA